MQKKCWFEVLLTLVPYDVGAALAGNDDVFPAVTIEVVDADLQADPGSFSCGSSRDEMLAPCMCFGDPVVVLDSDVVVGTGILAGMAVVALAGDEFRLAVVVNIIPGQ